MIDRTLTSEQIDDLEHLLETFRRRTAATIAGIIILAVTLGFAIFAVLSSRYDADATRYNATSIAALNRELTAERQQSDAQAKLFSQFLRDFTAEQDYVCRIAASFAVQHGLEPPKPGVCAVVLPTPAPAPTAPPTSPSRQSSPAPIRAGATPSATAPTAPSPSPSPTARPLLPLPQISLPPLPSVPFVGAAHQPARHCGLVDALLNFLAHRHAVCTG